MSDTTEYLRSPELMSRDDTALLVIDVQEKLISLIRDQQRVVWNIRRLLDGAEILGVTKLATEQYPKGLARRFPCFEIALPKFLKRQPLVAPAVPSCFPDWQSKGFEMCYWPASKHTSACNRQHSISSPQD